MRDQGGICFGTQSHRIRCVIKIGRAGALASVMRKCPAMRVRQVRRKVTFAVIEAVEPHAEIEQFALRDQGSVHRAADKPCIYRVA
jgi:hypothetical protein